MASEYFGDTGVRIVQASNGFIVYHSVGITVFTSLKSMLKDLETLYTEKK